MKQRRVFAYGFVAAFVWVFLASFFNLALPGWDTPRGAVLRILALAGTCGMVWSLKRFSERPIKQKDEGVAK